MIATEVRWSIVDYLLYLLSDVERFGAQGGEAYGRLLQLCIHCEAVGPRVLKTLLGFLRISSLVTVSKDAEDRRVFYYKPTAQMDVFVSNWMSYAIAALDLLEPEGNRARFLKDPTFMTRFNVSGGRAHLADAVPLVNRMPEPLSRLSPMLCSFPVVAGLMEADLLGSPVPSVAKLAWRFGISRGQVRNIIAAGREEGLFSAAVGNGVMPTSLLRECFARWVSIELTFYAQHMRDPNDPPPPIRDHFF